MANRLSNKCSNQYFHIIIVVNLSFSHQSHKNYIYNLQQSNKEVVILLNSHLWSNMNALMLLHCLLVDSIDLGGMEQIFASWKTEIIGQHVCNLFYGPAASKYDEVLLSVNPEMDQKCDR